MRVLVTGGTGFIGSHLLPVLARGHEVVALARRPPAGGPEGVTWVRQDLARRLEAKRLPGHVDAVVHLAHSRHFREFPEAADDIFAVNVQGTFELLRYAREAGAEAFVYASTGGVYDRRRRPLSERDAARPLAAIRPLGCYVSTKYAGELLVDSYQPFFRTVVLRFFFVYGVGQEGMLMPRLLELVNTGQTVTIEGRPGLRINPIHVRDVVRAFEPALALQRSGLFNVAGDEQLSMRALVRLIERISGKSATTRHVAELTPGELVADTRQLKEVLGVHPAVSLLDGLTEMQRHLETSRGR